MVLSWIGRDEQARLSTSVPCTSAVSSPVAPAGELQRLQDKADKEGFLDTVFGTQCYSQAVNTITASCHSLESDEALALAFKLTNCFFSKTGRHPYICADSAIQQCTSTMTAADYVVFTGFFQNVQSMCLFVANTDFNRRAETMLNALYHAGGAAAEQVLHATCVAAAANSCTHPSVTRGSSVCRSGRCKRRWTRMRSTSTPSEVASATLQCSRMCCWRRQRTVRRHCAASRCRPRRYNARWQRARRRMQSYRFDFSVSACRATGLTSLCLHTELQVWLLCVCMRGCGLCCCAHPACWVCHG